MQQTDPFVAILRECIEVFMGTSMHGFVRYSKEIGLSMSQLGAMFHLFYEGGGGVKGLGDHLGVSSAAASQMLERLVQQHLILRSEDPSDRRVKHLVLTERGIKTIQESIRSREEWMGELSKTLSADEKAQVVTALNILIEKTQRLNDPAVSAI
jgi:DNA-binding MarR family transcriptional regulator